jgi:hypothetical protein
MVPDIALNIQAIVEDSGYQYEHTRYKELL